MLPWVQPFCMEEDDVSMSSAAAWGRRVLLRVRMLGACYMGLLHGSLFGSRALGGLALTDFPGLHPYLDPCVTGLKNHSDGDSAAGFVRRETIVA